MDVERALAIALYAPRSGRRLTLSVHNKPAREFVTAAGDRRNCGEIIIAEIGGAKYPRHAALVHAGQKLEVVIDHVERRGEERHRAGANASRVDWPILYAADPVLFPPGLE